jgi:molecular chaperone DnaK
VIVGIDLGTTFSSVATVDQRGRPVALANVLGERAVPSVVHFESPSAVWVGTVARDAVTMDPDNTVALIKRQMGNEHDLLFHGVRHTPESVSALILRSLVDTAASQLGRDDSVRAVITVPAYFGIREREATSQAARLAGIDVLELLSEPVAAALHYGVSAVGETSAGSAVLVYDLGGGTFDTTVLRVGRDGVTVVTTDGDSKLGGADWDERIAGFIAESFSASAGVDPYDDDELAQRLARIAESAKLALTEVTTQRITLRAAGATAVVELDRETLDRIGSDLVGRTITIVDRVLAAAAAKGVPRVDDVVLVGGASRMPVIADTLGRHLGVTPRLVEPDFAVVFGAAIRAHQLASDESRSSLRRAGGLSAVIAGKPTTSVVSRSFGVLLHDSHDPAGLRQIVAHTVHRNTPLPASATAEFCTIVNDQDKVRVQVFEQAGDLPSEDPAHNRRVLDGELIGLPKMPAGSRIEVTLRVSVDGLLSVTAREPRSGAELTLQAYVDGVVDAHATDELAGALTALMIRN